ncbi:MAG TPA: FAD-binding oxidoreductase [Candidatus Sulfotelmatobacter sp.]|nr:FAD-binding oxidoreductase [Candidatus Sulfotelmatobacter sp.]
MSKVANYLQEHLVGEVISTTNARQQFSTDGGIFQVAPAIVVYPRNENDIRKTSRFCWQLAERGRVIPITARGFGTDQTGAAIGRGVTMVFPAHMKNILELDSKSGNATVEPGISLGKLEQTLNTHGHSLPVIPSSAEYTSLGGAIANNTSGDKSFKYGPISNFVKGLRVVLANGEVIVTKRLSKRELNKKLGLATFEGEIYRFIDTLLEEQHDLLANLARGVTHNNAGYNLLDIKQKNGSFDLTPLIAGSQGTLGIISEIDLSSETLHPKSLIIEAGFDSTENLQQAVNDLRSLDDKPESIELIDQHTIKQLQDINPNHLKEVLPSPVPPFMLLIEIAHDGHKKTTKKVFKILDELSRSYNSSEEPEEQIKYHQTRDAIGILSAHNEGLLHPIPLLDGAVPPDRIRDLIDGLYKLQTQNHIKHGLWGHIGDGNIFFQPKLNLGQVGDRQKVFRLIEEYTQLILNLNGTLSSSEGDGRLKTPFLEQMYGTSLYNVLQKLKQVFDPYGILNPSVKFDTNLDDLKAIVRNEYHLRHLYDYLPRS